MVILILMTMLSLTTVSSQESFENAWNEYVDRVTTQNDLQEACVPRYAKAENVEKKKGVVVLFHGFSACPQQCVGHLL